jgi:hypothetical protein
MDAIENTFQPRREAESVGIALRRESRPSAETMGFRFNRMDATA